MAALSKKTPAALLRQEVEARTGTCQNMRDLGYKAVRYTLTGEPVEFWPTDGKPGSARYIVKRTHGKKVAADTDNRDDRQAGAR